jgi:hypothetical protein
VRAPPRAAVYDPRCSEVAGCLITRAPKSRWRSPPAPSCTYREARMPWSMALTAVDIGHQRRGGIVLSTRSILTIFAE